MLALTGQVNSQVLGPGAFQEIDLASAFAPVARFSQTVLRDSRAVELMNLACKNAIVERDVAHLIFPDEVQNLPAGEDEKAHEVMESLKRRDQTDATRKTDPLVVAPGARVIDSTSMTLEDVIQTVVNAVRGEQV